MFVETDEQWQARVTHAVEAEDPLLAEASAPPPSRVRPIGLRESVAALHSWLAGEVGGDPDLAIYDNEVTTAGRLE